MGGVTDYKTSSFSGRSNSMQVASFFGNGKLSGFILVTHLSLAEILSKIMLYSQTYSAVVSRVIKQKTFNNFSVQKETYLRTHYFYFNTGKFV